MCVCVCHLMDHGSIQQIDRVALRLRVCANVTLYCTVHGNSQMQPMVAGMGSQFTRFVPDSKGGCKTEQNDEIVPLQVHGL